MKKTTTMSQKEFRELLVDWFNEYDKETMNDEEFPELYEIWDEQVSFLPNEETLTKELFWANKFYGEIEIEGRYKKLSRKSFIETLINYYDPR